MNHNRDSTVSSIVDLYGAEAPTTDSHDRERYPDIQEEDSDDHIGGVTRFEHDQDVQMPTGSSPTDLPALQDPTLAGPDPSHEPLQRTLHPSRSALTSGSSYQPSSHLREQSSASASSSFRAAPGSSTQNGRFGNGRIGLNGAYNESAASFASVQQPGEEDDAYHVRSTCEISGPVCIRSVKAEPLIYRSSDARLEVQGVYGDGWDEGVERTRERAIMKRRTSDPPAQRGDGLGENERQALARVDR